MILKDMFYAKLGSPQTNLSGTINNLDTDIYVTDGNALPDAPNVLIIYDDNNLEVIKYSTKVGNKLGNCTRGYGGSTALNWDAGKVCGRFITSIEHNNMKDNIEGIYKEVNTAAYQAPVTTNAEVNPISVDKNKFVKVDIKGRTVINLLGSDGDCEDVSKWGVFGSTTTLYGTNKVFGNSGIKITISTSPCSIYKFVDDRIDKTKYYCYSAYVKNGNANRVYLMHQTLTSGGTSVSSTVITDTTKFNRVFLKVPPSSFGTQNAISIVVEGTASQYAYADGLMIEEITASQYNDPTFTLSPYVNNDLSVGESATRIKATGKNLCPISSISIVDSNVPNAVLDVSRKIKLKKGVTYTISGVSNLSGSCRLDLIGYIGNTPMVGDILGSFTTSGSVQLTPPWDMDYYYLRVVGYGTHQGTTLTFSNIQIEEGSTTTVYEPYKETYLPIPYPLRSLPNGVVDEIKDGKLIKRVEKVQLDGFLSWGFNYNLTGAKRVGIMSLPALSGVSPLNCVLLKYNNKRLPLGNSFSGNEEFNLEGDGSTLYLIISNSDSGWGDSYTPTTEEIRAYFNGWRMCLSTDAGQIYNNTGSKAWVYANQPVSINNALGATTTLPTTLAPNYTPYRLYYQLATPITTEINEPNLVAYPNGNLVVESDSQYWVRPSITYTLCDNEKASIDEIMRGLSDARRYKKPNIVLSARLSTAQAIPSGISTKPVNVEFRIQETGLYLISAEAVFSDSFDGQRDLYLMLNGSNIKYAKQYLNTYWTPQTLTVPLYLAKNDYLCIYVSQSSGSSKTLAGASLIAIKVGD